MNSRLSISFLWTVVTLAFLSYTPVVTVYLHTTGLPWPIAVLVALHVPACAVFMGWTHQHAMPVLPARVALVIGDTATLAMTALYAIPTAAGTGTRTSDHVIVAAVLFLSVFGAGSCTALALGMTRDNRRKKADQ